MNIKTLAIASTVVVGALAVTAPVRAQTTYKKDIPDSLAKRATITETAAAETAKKRVPKAEIAALELEVENGKLMYSFDMKTAGKRRIDEVNVDAKTGKIIGFAHESAATEAKEAAAEAKETKAAAKATKPKKP